LNILPSLLIIAELIMIKIPCCLPVIQLVFLILFPCL